MLFHCHDPCTMNSPIVQCRRRASGFIPGIRTLKERLKWSCFSVCSTVALLIESQELLAIWCRGRGTIPHGPFGPQDFKSCASASSATPAFGERFYRINELRGLLVGIVACIRAIVPAICP